MTEEHRSIVQRRLISNLLRSTVWITSVFWKFFKSLLVFLQQVSLSLSTGLRFCKRRLCKNLHFIQLTWCFGFLHSSLTNWLFFNHVRYCSVKTELIDGDDNLESDDRILRSSAAFLLQFDSKIHVVCHRPRKDQ